MRKQNKQKRQKKETIVRVIAIVLAVLLVGGVIVSALPAFAQEETPVNHYALDLSVDPDAQSILVREQLDYVNLTGRPIDYVMFHLYANTLRRQEAIPVESSEWNDAFPDGFAPGGVDFIRISADSKPAEWAVSGEYEQYLRVSCALEPGQTVRFEFEFYLLLPQTGLMLGVGDLGWRLANFYPVAAVYDASLEDFCLNPWSLPTDPLMSDTADYEAVIRLNERWTLASTGTQTASEPDENGLVTWTVSAPSSRDLSLAFSRKMNERSARTESGVTVRAYASTAYTAQAMLDAAVSAMSVFTEWFGDYPGGELELMETDYLRDGLSNPGLIQISKSLCALNRRDELEKAVVTLCARQWFGGVVGCNPENEPWMNDALSAYAALLYDEQLEDYDAYLKRLNGQVLSSLQVTIPGGLTVDSNASRFNSLGEYDIVVIDRGCAVMHEVRALMGRDQFIASLRRYIDDNRFAIASVEQFVSALNAVTGERWDEYVVGEMHNISDYVNATLTWFE